MDVMSAGDTAAWSHKMPSARPPPPEHAPPAAPLLARAGSLLGAGTIAALIGTIPAASRVAADTGAPLVAWIALAACATAPAIVAVALARAARDGARTVAGPDAQLATWGVATWAIATFLALSALGALLRATTHHHGLAGVTFAIGGLVVAGGLALVVRRLQRIASAADPWGRAALVVCVMSVLVCALFVVVFRVARAGGAGIPSASLVDLLAFAIATGALSRQTFARVAWLAIGGVPLTLGVLGLGWALLTRDPPLRDAVRAHAPLLAPMAALARAR